MFLQTNVLYKRTLTYTSVIKQTCPTFTSLKNEYEARTAKLMQDMETCWNHQDIGMSIEYYMMSVFVIVQINVNLMNKVNSRTKISRPTSPHIQFRGKKKKITVNVIHTYVVFFLDENHYTIKIIST